MSNSALLKSSIAKKYWMALTGLFLCLFLVGHLLGNLQLLISPENGAKDQFNEYAYFMTHNPLIMVMSYITYISILFHAIDGFMLAAQNRKARPQKYAYNKPSANSSWASRNMAFLGVILLLYIISHMAHFWWKMKFGPIDTYMVDGVELKDLYTVTVEFFTADGTGLIWTIVYVVCMVAIALHLNHGFQSAFQSLGVRHAKYTPIIKGVGKIFAIIIPLAFAYIPVHIYLNF